MKHRRLILILCLSFLSLLASTAQDIIVDASKGRLIAGLGETNEFGFIKGWKSMWWHKQAPCKFFASDNPDLNASGLLRSHACNINVKGDNLVVGCIKNGYFQFSMPDGYRIVGYTITLKNNLGTSYEGLDNTWTTDGAFSETTNDFNTEYTSTVISRTKGETAYTISRTALDIDDASNSLFFKFTGGATNNVSLLSIENFVVKFTVENQLNVSMKPTADNSTAVSYVAVPFETGKIALGDIRQRTQTSSTYGSATHNAYEYHEVEELDADILLYNENSVQAGRVENVTSADAATITQEIQRESEGDVHYYGMKNGTYYIESPVEVVTTHGNHDPIGYRIVEGSISYNRGTNQSAVQETITENQNMFSIRSTLNIDNVAANGTSVYYLHPSGRYVRQQEGNTTTKLWQRDSYGRIFHEQDGEYTYLGMYRNSSYSYAMTVYRTTSPITGTTSYVNDDDNHYVYLRFTLTSGNMLQSYQYNSYYIAPQWNTELSAYRMAALSSTYGSTWNSEQTSRTVNQPAYTATDWRLTLYNKDNTVLETIDVNSSNPKGTISFSDFNNDAVKFKVEGLPTGTNYRALMTFNISMQPLDPYINSVEIECENSLLESQITEDLQKRLTQPFVISDFTMSGADFTFYVPENWSDLMPCTFYFKDLRSKYMDETYYDNKYNGDTRNSLVGSEYYGLNAAKDDVVYKNVYTTTEPNSGATDYTDKVNSFLCGEQPFYFSNADELDHDYTSTAEKKKIRTLHQYQFSPDNYRNQTQTVVDGYTIGYPAGRFSKLVMNENDSKHAYLFVCDEPRYNIAPTTATEHRMYAYYDMTITLVVKNFTPKLTWEKLYDEIQYAENPMHEDSQWGVKVETTEAEKGYLPISVIKDKINTEIEDNTIATPDDISQILYVDASEMSRIIYAENTGGDDDLDKFKKQLSKNVLFYLPLEMQHEGNNYAYKNSAGGFTATENIVLTDRKPFFAPHDIEIDVANYAQYTREITIDGYTATKYGTLLLPFNLLLNDDGIHIDRKNDCEFRLFRMNATNCLSVNKEDLQTGAVGYFGALKTENVIPQTEANEPYMFDVSVVGNSNITLIAEQAGATIKATPRKNSYSTGEATAKKIHEGETAWGKISGEDYIFTHCGTYGGEVVPKATGGFYLAQNKFLNTISLEDDFTALNVIPFRSWYKCETSGGINTNINTFSIVFGENEDFTGIDDTAIQTQDRRDNVVYSINGQCIGKLDAEETNNTLSKGIYIMNGRKLIVK